MDDLTPVKGPPTPFEGRSAKVLGLIIVGLLVALIKPWGSGPAPIAPAQVAASSSTPTQVPVAVEASPSPFDPFANYDHEIFGVYEPEPRWELWPAGYLVSFGYAIRIESSPTGPDTVSTGVTGTGTGTGSTASPGPSSVPTGSPTTATPPPAPAPTPTAPAGDGPTWPATIRVTHSNELAMIGVNMPLGYRLTDIAVTRRTDGADEAVRYTNPASDWPSHFTVIALADESGAALDRWPAGDYRLELTFEPDHIVRTVEIQIEVPPSDDPTSSGAPAASPDPSAGPAR